MSENNYPPLHPCPFCGETAETHVNLVDQEGIAWVTCTNCSTEGPTTDTAEQAVDLWNRRTQRLPLTDEQIERATGTKRGQPLFLAALGFARAVEAAHGIGGHVINKGETK